MDPKAEAEESLRALRAVNAAAKVGALDVGLAMESVLQSVARRPDEASFLPNLEGMLSREIRWIIHCSIHGLDDASARSWIDADDEGIREGVASLVAWARKFGYTSDDLLL